MTANGGPVSDPWSPEYVTPAATPSGPRAQTPQDEPAKPGAPIAVSVRGASHSYVNYNFNGKTTVPVLHDFNMTVLQGHIYALLGSSGCGKTTVLRAMVGQHRLTAGRVEVFGKEPRSRGIGIPGPSLGYMPQELAVHDGFTIHETLRFFGWLAGMDTASIDRQSAVLLRLLDLPSRDRLVCNLSGGQQRRVSLAVALLHSPPLLILDEPTVGVDPLVRQSVWEHLLDLTESGRTTVIITTHYIDEARQANVAGLMRKGALLAEESPSCLMDRFSCASLEEVLLKLCLVQDADSRRQGVQRQLQANGKRMEHELEAIRDVSQNTTSSRSAAHVELRTSKTSSRFKALLWKNLMWNWRHPTISVALIFLPAFIATVYCGGVGAPPRGLHLAIVNRESNCTAWTGVGALDCSAPRDLSCIFLDEMRAETIQPVMFLEEGDAVQAVLDGHAWGVVEFAANFSESLVERAGLTVNIDSPIEAHGAVESANVKVRLDMSLQTIGHLLQQTLVKVTSQALEVFNGKCALTAHMIRPPLQFNTELQLLKDPTFLEYSIPGLILSVVFMFGFTTTMSSLLPEKTDKILERSLVYGVHMAEVLLAQFLTQLLVVVGQITLVLLVAFPLFGNHLFGHVFTYIMLCLAQGACGMWFGLFIAVIFDSTTSASLIGVGSYFTLMFLSSMLWPVEGMQMLLRPIATMLPMTTATISLRNIALRAWSLCHPGVYIGFLATFSWSIAFIILTFLTIKLRF